MPTTDELVAFFTTLRETATTDRGARPDGPEDACRKMVLDLINHDLRTARAVQKR